jgi:hypothetical protein
MHAFTPQRTVLKGIGETEVYVASFGEEAA